MPRRRLSASDPLPGDDESSPPDDEPEATPEPREPTDLERAVALLWLAHVDINVFVELVLRGEEHKEQIVQAPHHREMQAAFDRSRVVMFEPVGHGKSFQLVGRVLWEMGRNPLIRVAYVSGSAKQAKKFVKALREYIESSEWLHAVFPALRKSSRDGAAWTQTELEIERPYGVRDATIVSYGDCNDAILGSRLDLIVLDDILDNANTRTPEQREKVLAWIGSSVSTRTEPGASVWVVGTPWHPNDAMHELSKKSAVWHTVRRAAIEGGVPIWPLAWPMSRIEARKAEQTELEFARTMLCQARDDATARFRPQWFERARARGLGQSAPFRYRGPLVTVAGVDLAVGQRSENDETAIATLAVHPDGTRQILYVEAGRWNAMETKNKIIATWRRYDCQVVYVEANAAQRYMVDMVGEASGCPVEGFVTGSGKHDPVYGFEQMAVELANGKWVIPTVGDAEVMRQIQRLVEEVLFYSPSEHTGDRAMACYMAREAAKAVGGSAVAAPSLAR